MEEEEARLIIIKLKSNKERVVVFTEWNGQKCCWNILKLAVYMWKKIKRLECK